MFRRRKDGLFLIRRKIRPMMRLYLSWRQKKQCRTGSHTPAGKQAKEPRCSSSASGSPACPSIAEDKLDEIALLFVMSISETDSRNAEATRLGTAFPVVCSAFR